MLVSFACNGSPDGSGPPAEAPQIPAASVRSPSVVQAVDRQTLIDEAIDPVALGAILDGTGFVTAAERVSRVASDPVREIGVRVLRFGSATGAADYLSWVEAHATDLLGTAVADGSIGDVAVFRHDPGGCCPEKDLAAYLAATAGGDIVTIVTVRGTTVDRTDLVAAWHAATG